MRMPGLVAIVIACLAIASCGIFKDDRCGQELCVKYSLTTCELARGVSTGYGLAGLQVARPKGAPSAMQMYTLKVTAHTTTGDKVLIDRQANVTETTPFILPLRYNSPLKVEARTIGGDGKTFAYELGTPPCS